MFIKALAFFYGLFLVIVLTHYFKGLKTEEDRETFLNLLDQIVSHVNRNA